MATGDIAQRNNSSLSDVQSLLAMFKGGPTTTQTTSETVSNDKANAYIKSMLESTQGLAAVSSGQKSAGMYNSTTNQLLTDDLLSRTAAQTAQLSSTKTTSASTGRQANPITSVLGLAGGAAANSLLSPLIKTGAKKLGVDKWGQELSDAVFGGNGSALAPSTFNIGSEIYPAAFDSTPINSSALQNLDDLTSSVKSGGGSSVVGDVAAIGAGAAGASALGSMFAAGATDAAVTGGGYAIAAGATEFAASTAVAAGAAEAGAAVAGGAGIGETILAAIALWIVCTELHKQGRMPHKFYLYGARKFATYDDQIKAGYYVWAIPAVKHLRAKPTSLYSKLLEIVFFNRAEYVAAQAGCKSARKTLVGAVATYGVHAICWTLSRTVARTAYTREQITGAINAN